MRLNSHKVYFLCYSEKKFKDMALFFDNKILILFTSITMRLKGRDKKFF